MKCPRCVQRVHRSARQCPHCGFSIIDADEEFGAQVKLSCLTDSAGVLRRKERQKAKEVLAGFQRNFPQLFFAAYFGAFKEIPNLRQFGFWQGAFVDSTAPKLLQTYPLSTTAPTKKLANLMQHGVRSTDIAATRGIGCTPEYVTEVQKLWPINEIPPGGPLFPDSRQSKKA